MTATLTGPPTARAVPPVPAPPPVEPAATEPAMRPLSAGLVRFTVDQATRMVELGILPEDASVELLDGLLVRRQCGPADGDAYVEGDDHNYAVAALAAAGPRICSSGGHVWTRSLLVLTGDYSPYPDGLILRGPVTDHRGRRPTTSDVLCLVEVADSSYPRDAGDKRDAYAAAGIAQYVIIDVRRRQAEVYANPADGAYPTPAIIAADGTIPLRVGDDGQTFALPLADLLA